MALATTSKSLHATLRSSLVPLAFEGLVDSGSSDCFLDSGFVTMNKLPFQKIAPLPIMLIDGTINAYVNSIIMLPIEFSCGYSYAPEFYVTKLEGTYPVVLSYSWLSQYNSTIDWTEGTMLCQKPAFIQLPLPFLLVQDNITPDHTKLLSPLIKETIPPIKPPPPEPVAPPKTSQIEGPRTTKPSISFVSATTFQRACRIKEAVVFQLSPGSQMLTR